MAQIERPVILTVGKEVNNWTCPTLLVGTYRGAIIHTIPYKVKHIPTTSTHTRTSYHSVDPQVGTCGSHKWELVKVKGLRPHSNQLKFENQCPGARTWTLRTCLVCYLSFSGQSCEVKEFYSHPTQEETKAQTGHLTHSSSLHRAGLEFGQRSGLCAL